jgi:outer membrane protein assembly factor BamC
MKNIIYLTLLSLLISCSATEEIYDDLTSPDYVSSSKSARLEVPPDLSELEQSESYSVPGEAKSYKDYLNREEGLLASSDGNNQKKIISNPDGIKIVKSGNLRWLVVDKDPDIIWPHVKDFWEELGFRVLVANKRTGIIETEWMDTDDLKLDSNTGVLSTFDKWLDSLSGFKDKRKFRTRVEYGEGDITEIYISQRSAEAAADQHVRILKERDVGYNPSTLYKIEEYKEDSADGNGKKVDISETRNIDDYEIDSELLTRLMMKLGASNLDAENKINNPEIIVKSEFINNKTESYIKLFDPYDRAWRRLGLALDIIGFVTEDKNRSDGIYYVRFSEIDLPEQKDESDDESGIIDTLIFWDDDKKNKDDHNSEENISDEEIIYEKGDKKFTGIETPEIKSLDEDYNNEEFDNNINKADAEEETWFSSIWPSWGSEDESKSLPDNEKRYRVRIKPGDNNITNVYLDYPSGRKNNSNDAKKVLKILHEHLK